MSNDKNQKLHHHLITGKIVFSLPDQEDVHLLELNAVVASPSKNIPVGLIGKAQQTLQLQFFQRMENPELQVRDVIISNLCYLGEMTEAEFHAPPEGHVQKEKTPVDPMLLGEPNALPN